MVGGVSQHCCCIYMFVAYPQLQIWNLTVGYLQPTLPNTQHWDPSQQHKALDNQTFPMRIEITLIATHESALHVGMVWGKKWWLQSVTRLRSSVQCPRAPTVAFKYFPGQQDCQHSQKLLKASKASVISPEAITMMQVGQCTNPLWLVHLLFRFQQNEV